MREHRQDRAGVDHLAPDDTAPGGTAAGAAPGPGAVGVVVRAADRPRSRVCAPTPPRRGAAAPSARRAPARLPAGVRAQRPAPGHLRLVPDPPAPPSRQRTHRLRRAAAGLAVALAAAALVIGLGRLADGMAHLRATDSGPVAVEVAPFVGAPVDVTVTVHAPGTVWDVVDAVAPGASAPQRSAMADRVVAVNDLPSVRVAPGQVLRVPLRG